MTVPADFTAPAGRVADALEAAAIPAGRQGSARAAPLSPPERDLYFSILRRFAAAAPPDGGDVRAAAARLRLNVGEVLATLARHDLVHTDTDGRPLVAYPFSAAERGHRVLIDGSREVQAMCAIDALGIAPMLNAPIEVLSRDPISNGEVRVELRPREAPRWHPADAVVLAGSARCDGPSFCGCCDVLNFFETQANAERYLVEHPDVGGAPISIPEAVEVGRIVFGDVLRDD